jgi:hypothetical protein
MDQWDMPANFRDEPYMALCTFAIVDGLTIPRVIEGHRSRAILVANKWYWRDSDNAISALAEGRLLVLLQRYADGSVPLPEWPDVGDEDLDSLLKVTWTPCTTGGTVATFGPGIAADASA